MVFAAVPWPTWQHAWLTSALLIVIYLILKRRRPTAVGDAALPAVHELIVLTGLYGLWRTAKKLPLTQADGAFDRAEDIISFQERIGLPSELVVQEFLLDNGWLGWASAAYYYTLHVPGLFAFLGWMFWRHREQYGQWRNALALTTLGCLLIRFWHVAPPRFFPEQGFQDLSEVYGLTVYGPIGTGVSGQFVAMPSIHVAWAAVIGFGIIAVADSRWKWLFASHLPVTALVVSGTGHHWWLDGIVAVGLLIAAIVIDRSIRQLVASRHSATATTPSIRTASLEPTD